MADYKSPGWPENNSTGRLSNAHRKGLSPKQYCELRFSTKISREGLSDYGAYRAQYVEDNSRNESAIQACVIDEMAVDEALHRYNKGPLATVAKPKKDKENTSTAEKMRDRINAFCGTDKQCKIQEYQREADRAIKQKDKKFKETAKNRRGPGSGDWYHKLEVSALMWGYMKGTWREFLDNHTIEDYDHVEKRIKPLWEAAYYYDGSNESWARLVYVAGEAGFTYEEVAEKFGAPDGYEARDSYNAGRYRNKPDYEQVSESYYRGKPKLNDGEIGVAVRDYIARGLEYGDFLDDFDLTHKQQQMAYDEWSKHEKVGWLVKRSKK